MTNKVDQLNFIQSCSFFIIQIFTIDWLFSKVLDINVHLLNLSLFPGGRIQHPHSLHFQQPRNRQIFWTQHKIRWLCKHCSGKWSHSRRDCVLAIRVSIVRKCRWCNSGKNWSQERGRFWIWAGRRLDPAGYHFQHFEHWWVFHRFSSLSHFLHFFVTNSKWKKKDLQWRHFSYL